MDTYRIAAFEVTISDIAGDKATSARADGILSLLVAGPALSCLAQAGGAVLEVDGVIGHRKGWQENKGHHRRQMHLDRTAVG